MTTDNSVVAALRELRRVEFERRRREQELRNQERGRPFDSKRLGPQTAASPSPRGAAGSSRPPSRSRQSLSSSAPAGLGSYLASVVVAVSICAAAAIAGYWKLDGERRGIVARLTAERDCIERQRNEAVAGRSRAEQALELVRASLAAADSLGSPHAPARSPPLVARPGPRPATAPLSGARVGRLRARRFQAGKAHGPAGSAVVVRKAVNPNPKPRSTGTAKVGVARKKHLSEDPLDGLKL